MGVFFVDLVWVGFFEIGFYFKFSFFGIYGVDKLDLNSYFWDWISIRLDLSVWVSLFSLILILKENIIVKCDIYRIFYKYIY